MWKVFVLVFALIIKYNEGRIRCYNCFVISDLQQIRSEELVPCDGNITQSNIWDCPEEYPYCAWMYYEAEGDPSSQTVVRTCSRGKESTCNQMIPGLIERDCKLCEVDLCNGNTTTTTTRL